jgi:chromosome segregation ATPase
MSNPIFAQALSDIQKAFKAIEAEVAAMPTVVRSAEIHLANLRQQSTSLDDELPKLHEKLAALRKERADAEAQARETIAAAHAAAAKIVADAQREAASMITAARTKHQKALQHLSS